MSIERRRTSAGGARHLFGETPRPRSPAHPKRLSIAPRRERHPNLAAAQRLSERAYERIIDAQKANEFDLAGDAWKAKDLLDQVNNELKQAAQSSNRNHQQ
jgi:hypothetical protein